MSQTGQIQSPQRGEPIRASWARAITESVNQLTPFAVPRMLLRSGFGGSGCELLPENKRDRRQSTLLLPFSVKYYTVEGGDGGWALYLPGELLTIGSTSVNLKSQLNEVTSLGDGWFALPFLPAAGGTIYLNVTKSAGSGQISAAFDSAAAESSDDTGVVAAVQIAVASRSDSGAVTVRQAVTSALFLQDTDGDSVDLDSSGAIRLAHFGDTDRDSSKGLASRLKANASSGELEPIGDDDIMFVARKKGQLIYVPLSGDGDDPQTEDDEAERTPCAHPGDNDNDGGVSPFDNGSDTITPSGMDGGVAAGSAEVHPGDDNCNCP